ncbi:retinol dehydrogenase 11-like [Copidosoma floridanum]|uniref:retinol dehydrogenase 11-like n=1 Tax=Copidosoma floridanum TaxID=29053 RepID=UPI0006C981A3|nr:retinol dehydrogenase 11-like [Copidosoma floridanum]XP_014213899.1 retinol dehydrogenase 11-like [Copidosoma floridanum]
MVSILCYILLPVVLIAGLLRKCREYSWGRCKSKSNLEGRVFIVTGSNSGIGKEVAKELAKRKATVILACRNLQAAKATAIEIRHIAPDAQLISMELDLASMTSIRHFAAEVLKNFREIHVLINNAGVYATDTALTKDGFELHFGVNHLGHFLLTNLLLDRLKQSAPSRVVVVTSKLLESGVIDFNNLNGEKCLPVKGRMNPGYCNSKLANAYFATELASRTEGSGVSIYIVCPGFVYTGLFRHVKRSWLHYILFSPVALLFLRTPNQGAQTLLYCATDPDLADESGKLYRDCKVYNSKKKLEPEVAHRLWEVSKQLTGLEETS